MKKKNSITKKRSFAQIYVENTFRTVEEVKLQIKQFKKDYNRRKLYQTET